MKTQYSSLFYLSLRLDKLCDYLIQLLQSIQHLELYIFCDWKTKTFQSKTNSFANNSIIRVT